MNKFAGISAVAIAAISAPAYAGEDVRYESTPDWVQPAQIDMATLETGPSELLYDWQNRLENGTVHEYADRAVRIDNLDALTREGTLQFNWAPDKGDLFIHKLEILRDGEVIDLIADGVKFEIIRRERGLEQRLLDGRLTATVAVPGLKEGDVLRVARTTTIADQALGDEMQALQYLPSEPWRVGTARVIMSWPENEEITWRAEEEAKLAEPELRGGYKYLTVNLPLAKREDMPHDAPSRFSRYPILRVGSFASWQELSRVMEPHFTKAAVIPAGGDLEGEVKAIMAKTADPLKRTELAVRLVQDQVSYLLDGLDGGNYLPQDASDTWQKRYGDCKAKSVLLLAILRQMGIDADVVLVQTRGGDALPELLPMPANFDHMIVRATVDGVDYWLDGTSTATRLANMADVPTFYYALPLTPGGADLTPLSDRSQAYPDRITDITIDHSAGIDLPTTFTMRMEMSGTAGARLRSIVDENDPEVKKRFGRGFGGGALGRSQVTSVDITYDNERAVGTVILKGVADPVFQFADGDIEVSLASANNVRFAPNRARPKWREIPVATFGPSRNHNNYGLILPNDGKGFALTGTKQIDESYANTRVVRRTIVDGALVRVEEEQINDLGEIPVSDLPDQRRAALKIAKADLTLRAPEGSVWRWERDKDDLAKRTKEALAGYNVAVADADDDDFGPLQARAAFFWLIYDYENALKDYNTVINEEPTSSLFLQRAYLYEMLGQLDKAEADIQAAYDLSPSNDTAYYQAQIIARAGRPQEALDLLELLPVSEDEQDGMVAARSIVLGLNGDVEAGLAVLAQRREEKANSSEVLNADCWYRGLHKVALDDAINVCTRAVERTSNAANVLDSRAMVHYRMGDYASALADIEEALKLSPDLAATRYLKGIVLLEQGDANGRDFVRMALRQSPELADQYALYGIVPKL
ncbi:DUF3857 domain-containing protein [Pontixanthobacter aquaemixtae]|uniref:Tetratricopeptide repeat protein n=1 Tax=Pontixanthobacter aquaemixtae TaxID=1958940 RepID=A0A844ZTA2_9SPHN|nr:DUF3857 domain-containing protein [Pontixanthobacter aquaemixtae]MXO90532.1 tetratricopeptide repeat protein [Pontixanthobacter aquaemixtae]